MSFLRNSGFETGQAAPWIRMNKPGATTMQVKNDPAVARSGSNYMVLSTSTSGGSVAQDFPDSRRARQRSHSFGQSEVMS